MLKRQNGDWICVKWSKLELEAIKQKGDKNKAYWKSILSSNTSEERQKYTCEVSRNNNSIWTRGKNDTYSGCKKCWCCSPKSTKIDTTIDTQSSNKRPSPVQNITPPNTIDTQSSNKRPSPVQNIAPPNTIATSIVYFPPPYNAVFISSLNKLQYIMKKQREHFRSIAYRKAKESIQEYDKEINHISQLSQLKGVGPSIIQKLTELVTTGKISIIENYSENLAPELQFINIYGIGSTKASEIVNKYKITTIEDLRKNTHILNKVQNIGLKYYEDLMLRIPRREIDLYDKYLTQIFDSIKYPTSFYQIVGSYRRGNNTSGDIDVIISDPNNQDVFTLFIDQLIQSGLIIETLSKGSIKCLAISKLDKYPFRRIDFLFTPNEELSFALLYFTGSKTFNTAMRQRALKLGYSMNEHGLYNIVSGKKGGKVNQSFPTEKSIFDFLGLTYKRPGQRINKDSIIIRSSTKLPTIKIIPKKPPICTSGNLGKVVFKGGVLLAKEYKKKDGSNTVNPTGWWASEKYDGYRAIWNGKEFVSRNNKPFVVPNWFSEFMPPNIALDGELWMGRGGFQSCGLFRKKIADPNEWIIKKVLYKVFDMPSSKKPFEERMIDLKNIVDQRCQCKITLPLQKTVFIKCPIILTTHTKITSANELDIMFTKIIDEGGEGVMIRKPCSKYEQKRSNTLLKYKVMYDTECRIVSYKPGQGKYTGKLGSFGCKLLTGNQTIFYVSGMTDTVRNSYKKTHPKGTIITILYNDKTQQGIPRHPRYYRIRDDCSLQDVVS